MPARQKPDESANSTPDSQADTPQEMDINSGSVDQNPENEMPSGNEEPLPDTNGGGHWTTDPRYNQ